MTQFEHDSQYLPKAEVVRVLRRLGIPEETINEIVAKLPDTDTVDLNEAAALLQPYGLTRDSMISRLGGSP